MSFRQTKRCSICMQSWVTHLKNNSIVTHSVYTLMLRLIHPANKRSPLFSMTSRKMQERESNQKPYISHKSTKPQVPQEGVQHSHPSLIEGAPVLWALGFETLVKEVPHKSQELQINLPSQIPGAPYRSALFFWWLQQMPQNEINSSRFRNSSPNRVILYKYVCCVWALNVQVTN